MKVKESDGESIGIFLKYTGHNSIINAEYVCDDRQLSTDSLLDDMDLVD